MNILVVTGSPRKGSNTEQMTDAFAQGATEAGNSVTIRHLSELHVEPCMACDYCFHHDGTCVRKDDMTGLLADVDEADALVVASPIYWFDVSAQAKCFIDRLYARRVTGYRIGAFALLLDAASPGTFEAATRMLEGICAFTGWENKGAFEAPGMKGRGSFAQTPYQQAAQDFGRTFATSPNPHSTTPQEVVAHT